MDVPDFGQAGSEAEDPARRIGDVPDRECRFELGFRQGGHKPVAVAFFPWDDALITRWGPERRLLAGRAQPDRVSCEVCNTEC